MKIIPENTPNVNAIGGFVPGGGDRAMLESNLSTLPAHRGEAHHPDKNLGGVNAINSLEGFASYEAASNRALDSVSGIPSPAVGLSPIYANSNTVDSIGVEGILKEFRVHLLKMEHTPVMILHLCHKENDSEVLYRVTACSTSRYFPEGRAALRRCILQRLGIEKQPGVFLTLTTDVKRYTLLDSWPMLWPNFNRFKSALNIYRKRHMKATGSVRYIAAIEPHQSDYPHLHVFFPGLRWLIKKPDITKMDKWWKMGCTRTEKERKSDSAGEYVTKYLTKLSAWSETSMALLWKYRIRLYNLSHCFYGSKEESVWSVRQAYRDPRELAREIDITLRSAEDIFDSEESFIWLVKDEGCDL
jgi:hypothetical protein